MADATEEHLARLGFHLTAFCLDKAAGVPSGAVAQADGLHQAIAIEKALKGCALDRKGSRAIAVKGAAQLAGHLPLHLQGHFGVVGLFDPTQTQTLGVGSGAGGGYRRCGGELGSFKHRDTS